MKSIKTQQWKNQIIKGLKNFGLNPREWRLESQSSDSPTAMMVIRHRKDQSFMFLAHLSTNKKRIQEIQLLSI